jgi:spermidine synthase
MKILFGCVKAKFKTLKMLYKKGGVKLILRHFLRKYVFIPLEKKTSLLSFLYFIILDKPLLISQKMEEFSAFISFLKEKNVRNVLEIGTYKGGSAFLFHKLLNANVTTIDIKQILLVRIALMLKGIRVIQGNSHDEKVLEKVKRSYDLLFIDGDHDYNGVKKDFEMYSHLVREGGIIAFHDIFSERGVNIFWNEIKRNYDYVEIKDKVEPYGIGVLIKKGKKL